MYIKKYNFNLCKGSSRICLFKFFGCIIVIGFYCFIINRWGAGLGCTLFDVIFNVEGFILFVFG